MRSLEETFEDDLHPLWAALGASISAMYGLWPANSMYESMVVASNDGFGWFPFLIFGPLAFAIVAGLFDRVLFGTLHWLENNSARGLLCGVLIVVVWASQGVPGTFGLCLVAFIAVFGFFHARKMRQDAAAREEFFGE